VSAVEVEKSEPAAHSAIAPPRYPALLARFAVGLIAAALLTSALLIVMDPYETGRLEPLPSIHWRANEAKTSRATDPAFDSAIIGNSRMMMIRPELLDERTGLKFVSLAIPGTQAREHLRVLRYVLQHHPQPRALVIGFDETWCFNPLPRSAAFEDWAYERGALNYILHLYGIGTVKKIYHLATDPVRSDQREDGFMDYEPAFHAAGADRPEIVSAKLFQPRPTVPFTSTGDFPAAEELRQILNRVPPATVVILAWEPVYIMMIPEPGSAAETALNACRAVYQRIAAARPRTGVVKWFVDRPENRDEGNFLDRVHYRHGVATAFGEDIAAAVNGVLTTNTAAVRKQ